MIAGLEENHYDVESRMDSNPQIDTESIF